MSGKTTVLTDVYNYDVSQMVFSNPQESNNSGIKYMRINIGTINPDGSQGDLIIQTPELFSFGVQENRNMETNKVSGYVMPLCLWNRKGATEEEKKWIDSFEKICERCKDYLVENRRSIKRADLEHRDLKKFNPIYRKKLDDGSVDESKGPLLYPKLIVQRKDGSDSILSMFFDGFSGEELNPLNITNCTVSAALKLESIFIGGTGIISLQVKLWEADVKLQSRGMKKLLQRPQKSSMESESNYDDNGSINGDDEPRRFTRRS